MAKPAAESTTAGRINFVCFINTLLNIYDYTANISYFVRKGAQNTFIAKKYIAPVTIFTEKCINENPDLMGRGLFCQGESLDLISEHHVL